MSRKPVQRRNEPLTSDKKSVMDSMALFFCFVSDITHTRLPVILS